MSFAASPSGSQPDAAVTNEATPAAEPDLIERVLQETLTASATGAPLDSHEMAALQDVARRHRGADLTSQPVLVDLVAALLQARFSALAGRGPLCQTLAERIAETLWGDPLSQQRLYLLWARLTEAVP